MRTLYIVLIVHSAKKLDLFGLVHTFAKEEATMA